MKHFFSRHVLAAGVLATFFTAVAIANHSWGGYHWRMTGTVLNLNAGDNVDARWDGYLVGAITDWNHSTVLHLAKVPGGANPKNCRPTAGRIEVCNSRYGVNGWLGIAQIWVSSGHISQAITKVNDSYFETSTYDTPAWRSLVMCQEIAHDFGLDHQDETFDNPNLGSCMDYTNDPDGGAGGAVNNDPSNERPNDHDFEQLRLIYEGHNDSTGGGSRQPAASEDAPEHPSQWGRLIRQNDDRRIQVFELDLGNGQKMLTHVYWADPDRDARGNRGQ